MGMIITGGFGDEGDNGFALEVFSAWCAVLRQPVRRRTVPLKQAAGRGIHNQGFKKLVWESMGEII